MPSDFKPLVSRFIAVLGAVVFAAALASPASAGNGQSIAFAGVSSSGGILSQGGADLVGASALRNGPGDYTVTFGGHFPKTVTAGQLVLNTTAEASTPGATFGSSSATVLSASASQIKVEVFTWDNSLSGADSNCFVTVFLGQTPRPPSMVDIEDDTYRPFNDVIYQGQTVVWTNKGVENHTVTNNPGVLDTCSPSSSETIVSPTLNPGDTFAHTFNSPGVFAYHCEIHGCFMKGTITVR